MNILVVEDNAADAVALSELFRQQGHEVEVSRNRDDLLSHCDRMRPDVVVLGTNVFGIDPAELTRVLLAHRAPRWLPVIVMTPGTDTQHHERMIEAGADACFFRSVAPSTLTVRLGRIARQLEAAAAAETMGLDIRDCLTTEADEWRVARHILEYRMAHADQQQLDDPAIEYWQRHCNCDGGDLLVFGRTPNGVLHVLLADARERGMAAYVSLQPVIMPFHRMTEKGFSLGAIACELNRKVCEAMPEGSVIPAQLIAVDHREGIVSAWNGGMPPAVMLDDRAHPFYEFSLCHAPLGSHRDGAFDERIESHALSMRGGQLIMVSDGLLDCCGTSGKRFGEQGLADAIVGLPCRQRRHAVVAALEKHLGELLPQDDMTVVLLDCEQTAALPATQRVMPVPSRHPGSWCIELRLGASELGHVDVVPMLLNVVTQFSNARDQAGTLFVILSELFNNALDHGILRLDSRIKHSPEGMETWLMMREERLAALREGEIRLSVEQVVDAAGVRLAVHCQDTGPGFDVQAVLARAANAGTTEAAEVMPFGRGLALLQGMATSLQYDRSGNGVTVTLTTDRGTA